MNDKVEKHKNVTNNAHLATQEWITTDLEKKISYLSENYTWNDIDS